LSGLPPYMPILRLLRENPYGPRDIEVMTKAYEEALRLLNIVDRAGPLAETIALRTIALFSGGETDVSIIARAATKEFTPNRKY
jgi:hypothetical protein